MAVTLHHETSPAIALAIARTACCMAGPILADSGLNAELERHPDGPYLADQAEWRGARLIFEWDGPVRVAYEPHGYQPDVLYDQHPHRAFVPVGTTKHLRLVGVVLLRGATWTESVLMPEFSLLKPREWVRWFQSRRHDWSTREAERIERELTDIARRRQLIEVVFPPDNPYEGHLRRKFPNVDWPRARP